MKRIERKMMMLGKVRTFLLEIVFRACSEGASF
jgi:hypothetical protein